MRAQTQAAMNAQARAEFERADAELNTTYQSALAKLPTAENKQKLKEAQRAWVASRDAGAARAAKDTEGGSMAPTIRYETMTELTRKRISELEAMIDKGSASASRAESSQSQHDEASSFAQAESSSPASTDLISPDKKWEYKAATKDHGPQIVKAGTDEATGDLSDDCDIGSCGDSANVQWAPDSKRFAFDWGQGRAHLSSFYQLRNDHWEPVKPAPDKEASERAQRDIEAQLKRKGLSTEKLEKKGLYLRYISSEEKLDRWIDANTALLYAGLRNVIAKREDPGEMSEGFGADFLFTIKFDAAGNWKIVKTHSMSQKEVDKREKEQ
jgi:uncharacterized protein YecT (DUF1311 family)